MGEQPDQTPSPAASYVETVMNNLHEEAHRCPVEVLNETVLEVKRLQKPHLVSYEDDDGEVQYYEHDDFAEVLGFAFVVTTGGPHLQFETTDQGRTWTGHYWDWFMSDQERVHLDGKDCALLHDVLGQWFDAFDHTAFEMRRGVVADLSAEEHHPHPRPFGTQEVSA